MEAMGIIGFIFGLAGLSVAMTAKNQLASLKQEFEDLKKKTEDSGVLNGQTQPEDK